MGRLGRRGVWRRAFATPLVMLLAAAGGGAALAEEGAPAASPRWSDEVLAGLRSSFALPWRELLDPESDSEWQNLLAGWSGAVGYSYPLKTVAPANGRGGQGDREPHLEVMTATVIYHPLGAWFVNATAYRYAPSRLQASWNPDFTYVFGYDDWHPYTLSLVYSNYGGNRWNPDRAKGEARTRFREGSWSLGWKFQLPRAIERRLLVPEESLGCAASFNLTPGYTDLAAGGLRHDKTSLSLGCKYAPYVWWYVNVKANYYLHPEQKQPWDPDFTYGIGYFDWHPGTISVQYNNYSGNRFPGRAPSPGTGRVVDGSLTVSYSWSP